MMKPGALLLALAFVLGAAGTAGAAVSDHREQVINLSVAYPVLSLDDTAAAGRINADMQTFAANFRAQFESGAFYRGELGYRVHLDDDNFLSVTFTDMRYALHDNQPTRRDYGFVYYKKTGQRLPTAKPPAGISTTNRDAARPSSPRKPSVKCRQTISSAAAAMSAPSFRLAN